MCLEETQISICNFEYLENLQQRSGLLHELRLRDLFFRDQPAWQWAPAFQLKSEPWLAAMQEGELHFRHLLSASVTGFIHNKILRSIVCSPQFGRSTQVARAFFNHFEHTAKGFALDAS